MKTPMPGVVIVREWEQQMSSSGCCGRLEGDLLSWNGERCFAGRRREMEHAGELYRAVAERFRDRVRIEIIDPRNLPAVVATLFRDIRRFRVPLWDALISVSKLAANTVIVNGRVFSAGAWPDPVALCDHIAILAGDRCPNGTGSTAGAASTA